MYTKLLLQGAIVIKHIGQIIVASLPCFYKGTQFTQSHPPEEAIPDSYKCSGVTSLDNRRGEYS